MIPKRAAVITRVVTVLLLLAASVVALVPPAAGAVPGPVPAIDGSFATSSIAQAEPSMPVQDDAGGDGREVPMPSADPAPSDWDGVVPAAGGLGLPSVLVPVPDVATDPLPGDASVLEVKLADGTDASVVSGRFTNPALADLQALLDVANATVAPLFARPEDTLDAERAEAQLATGQSMPDLASWVVVTLTNPDSAAGEQLAQQLRALPIVRTVQPVVELGTTGPGAAALPGQAAEEVNQYYLDGAGGIDAEYAWTLDGGSGNRVTVGVMDSGFDTSHPDLDRADAPNVHLANANAFDTRHGNHVLGILVADNDGSGLRGIVSEAGIRTVNSGTSSSFAASGINALSSVLQPGDVISVSQGICATSPCGSVVIPMVYNPSVRDAMRVATARGIIVVTSAGNGGANLDGFSSRLGSDAPSVIVVGAGNPATIPGCNGSFPARGRVSTSNYGSRVDLQGWGACVRTTIPPDDYTWWGFTSAATPIVAGAAASLSSVAEATRGITLTSDQVKLLLQTTGTPQNFSGLGGRIGPLPNLRAATDSLWLIPNNDMTGNARAVTSLPFSSQLQTVWAGVQVNEPALSCGSVSHSAWYRYTPPSSGFVTIDTSGSDYDTLLGLWESASGSLFERGCNRRFAPGVNQARMTPYLEAGKTYLIQVAGHNGAFGSMVFDMYLGRGRSEVCDLTDDGRSEIIVGSPGEAIGPKVGAGLAAVLVGRANGTLSPGAVSYPDLGGMDGASERSDEFGAVLACADFDGDGHDDLAVGVPGEALGFKQDAGLVHIVRGGPAGLVTAGNRVYHQDLGGVADAAEPGDRFGESVAAGDFNNDGYGDLAVGAPGESRDGKDAVGIVHILYGTSAGLADFGNTQFSQADGAIPGAPEIGDRFGQVLSSGDVNGDGYDDLVVGVPYENIGFKENAGAISILFGGSRGIEASGAWSISQDTDGLPGGAEPQDLFGAALAVGDVTGDGRAEIAVGSPGEAIGTTQAAGAVHLLRGSPGGIDLGQTELLHQGRFVPGAPEAGDAFGAALALGDITGDGRADLAVGVPGEGLGPRNNAGLVHIVNGSASGLFYGSAYWVHQDIAGVPGVAEADDRFGAALSLRDIDGNARADLVIGAPGEAVGPKADAGAVTVAYGDNAGLALGSSVLFTQADAGVGAPEPGDLFGSSVG